jgi:hypothetical protein
VIIVRENFYDIPTPIACDVAPNKEGISWFTEAPQDSATIKQVSPPG